MATTMSISRDTNMADAGALDNAPFIGCATDAAVAAERLVGTFKVALAAHVIRDGKVSSAALDRYQRLAHGYAWAATLAACLSAGAEWGRRLLAENRLGKIEADALTIGFAEYLGQLAGGIVMAQNEIVRPAEFDRKAQAAQFTDEPAVAYFLASNFASCRAELVELLGTGASIDSNLDSDLDLFRSVINRFATDRILPSAHAWHLEDALIPDQIMAEMAEIGVFGIGIDPEYGGLGLGKLAMCVVTEELSRAWIAAGSLGTRSEIAGELISSAGTEEQKTRWLPKIASANA